MAAHSLFSPSLKIDGNSRIICDGLFFCAFFLDDIMMCRLYIFHSTSEDNVMKQTMSSFEFTSVSTSIHIMCIVRIALNGYVDELSG